MHSRNTLRTLPDNSRFYILLAAVLTSLLIAASVRQHIAADQLFYIRLAQMFGFTALGFLYTALIIAPLSSIGASWRGMPQLLFARRAIGVAAFYFAVLHFSVAFWGQLGGWSALRLLPGAFLAALAFGFAALLIVSAMAFTSFDAVIRKVGFKRWKRLQQMVYLGGVLIILHVWIIGTHAAYGSVQAIASLMLALLFALESWRIGGWLAKRYPRIRTGNYFITVVVYIWLFLMSLLVIMSGRVQSYHGAHAEGKGQHSAH